MAFGLGAGACFYYVTLEDASPSRWFNGRTARLEESFNELTGAALELRTFEQGRRRRLGGGPRRGRLGQSASFCSPISTTSTTTATQPTSPATRSSSPDMTSELAQLSDTGFEELQTTRLENLDKARHSSHPAYPLAGHMFTASGAISASSCARRSQRRSSAPRTAMVEPEFRHFSGLDAVRRLAAEAGSWPEVAEDWQVVRALRLPGDRAPWHRRRRLPADVLALPRGGRPAGGSCSPPRQPRAGQSLATAFHAASEHDDPDPGLWREIDEAANRVAEAEEKLWTSLAEAN